MHHPMHVLEAPAFEVVIIATNSYIIRSYSLDFHFRCRLFWSFEAASNVFSLRPEAVDRRRPHAVGPNGPVADVGHPIADGKRSRVGKAAGLSELIAFILPSPLWCSSNREGFEKRSDDVSLKRNGLSSGCDMHFMGSGDGDGISVSADDDGCILFLLTEVKCPKVPLMKELEKSTRAAIGRFQVYYGQVRITNVITTAIIIIIIIITTTTTDNNNNNISVWLDINNKIITYKLQWKLRSNHHHHHRHLFLWGF